MVDEWIHPLGRGRLALAALTGIGARSVGSAFFVQGLASISTLLLMVLIGRRAGADDLGAAAIGLSGVLMVLTALRAFLSEPIIATAGGRLPKSVIRLGLGVCLLTGLSTTLVVSVVGMVVQGVAMEGVRVFSLWALPFLLHDYWRSVAFGAGRLWVAGVAEVIRLVPLTVALFAGSEGFWFLTSMWGLGSLAGAIFSVLAWRLVPEFRWSRLRDWYLKEVWHLGKWLGLDGFMFSGLVFAEALVISILLGRGAVGGIAAVATLFAPMTVIAPALSTAGIPLTARHAERSTASGLRAAFLLGGVALAATTMYLFVTLLFGRFWLQSVFGEAFAKFSALILPIGVGQVLLAAGVGFPLLLRVLQAGRQLVQLRTVHAVGLLCLLVVFIPQHGLSGAAWAGTLMNGINLSLVVWVSRRRARHRPA